MLPMYRLALLVGCAALLGACAGPARPPADANNNASVNTPSSPSRPTEAGSSVNLLPPSGGYTPTTRRAAIQRFGIELAATRKLSEPAVLALLADARYSETVIRIVSPPVAGQPRAPRSWKQYRGRFVEPIRINQGRAFMEQYSTELSRASERYGVPANIIAAIIGVETLYGRSQGNFRALDALTSLAFDYPDPKRPDRAELFRNQLADLIELDLTGRLDARSVKASYAGAIGIPQFMPGSIKRFAVSASGAAQINLSSSVPDAIVSVANFLVEHGWQRGLPVFAPVTLPASAGKLVDGGLKPTLDWPQLRAAGAKLAPGAKEGAWTRTALGVIDLPEESAGTVELRTATQNFFTITQYNRSYFYAASVADLAAELAKP
jgi:membrane-bound lytic murein transglycosylase B